MLYDLNNDLHRALVKSRLTALLDKRSVVELTEKKPKRTLPQNRYLHVVLGYFGLTQGLTVDYVKHHYFKLLVNPSIFVTEITDRYRGRVKVLRSSRDLTTDEMTVAIERFRDWAAQEAAVYIPSSDEHLLIQQMEIEYERARQYL